MESFLPKELPRVVDKHELDRILVVETYKSFKDRHALPLLFPANLPRLSRELYKELCDSLKIPDAKLRDIDSVAVEEFAQTVQHTGLILMRHGPQDSHEDKITQMKQPANMQDPTTSQGLVEFTSTLLALEYALQGIKNAHPGKDVTLQILSSKNRRAMDIAQTIADVFHIEVMESQLLTCLDYLPFVTANNENLASDGSSAVEWEEEKINNVFGEQMYLTITSGMQNFIHPYTQPDVNNPTLTIAITHTQQTNAADVLANRPPVRLANFGIEIFPITVEPSLQMKNGVYMPVDTHDAISYNPHTMIISGEGLKARMTPDEANATLNENQPDSSSVEGQRFSVLPQDMSVIDTETGERSTVGNAFTEIYDGNETGDSVEDDLTKISTQPLKAVETSKVIQPLTPKVVPVLANHNQDDPAATYHGTFPLPDRITTPLNPSEDEEAAIRAALITDDPAATHPHTEIPTSFDEMSTENVRQAIQEITGYTLKAAEELDGSLNYLSQPGSADVVGESFSQIDASAYLKNVAELKAAYRNLLTRPETTSEQQKRIIDNIDELTIQQAQFQDRIAWSGELVSVTREATYPSLELTTEAEIEAARNADNGDDAATDKFPIIQEAEFSLSPEHDSLDEKQSQEPAELEAIPTAQVENAIVAEEFKATMDHVLSLPLSEETRSDMYVSPETIDLIHLIGSMFDARGEKITTQPLPLFPDQTLVAAYQQHADEALSLLQAGETLFKTLEDTEEKSQLVSVLLAVADASHNADEIQRTKQHPKEGFIIARGAVDYTFSHLKEVARAEKDEKFRMVHDSKVEALNPRTKALYDLVRAQRGIIWLHPKFLNEEELREYLTEEDLNSFEAAQSTASSVNLTSPEVA